MNSNRFLIPESIVLYFLVFLLSLGVLGAALAGYYHQASLEAYFGIGSFSALNLEQPINLLTWFFSVIWVVMVVLAVTIICLTKENRLGLSHQLFWINIAMICLVMSANSICSFSTLIQNTFDRMLVNAKISETVRDLIYRFMYLGIAFFLFVELSLLFRYIQSQCQSRTLLRACFAFCTILFGLTLFCCWQIPNEAVSPESVSPSTREAPDQHDHMDRKAPRARGLIASQLESTRTKTLKTDEVKTRLVTREGMERSDSFRYASQEKEHIDKARTTGDQSVVRTDAFKNVSEESDYALSDRSATSSVSESEMSPTSRSSNGHAQAGQPGEQAGMNSIPEGVAEQERPKMKRWEDLFGWDKSLEELFGLKNDFEHLFGMNDSIEAFILGADVSLDLLRVRKIVRYGLFGLSLITLCVALALVARGGRMQINQRYRDRFSQYYEMNEGFRQVMRRHF